MTETDTFAALKFGTFTAEDIKQRWITNNNSKFESLPNEVRVRWLELLRDRYEEEVPPNSRIDFINKTNRYIELAKSGDYSSVSYASSVSSATFSSSVSSVSSFSFSFSSFCTLYSYSFSEADFTQEVMNKLAIDSKLLNNAIKEYSDD